MTTQTVLAGLIDKVSFAKEVGRSPRTIDNWIRAGLPVKVRRGRLRLLDIAEARAWLEGRSPEPVRRRRRRRQPEEADA